MRKLVAMLVLMGSCGLAAAALAPTAELGVHKVLPIALQTTIERPRAGLAPAREATPDPAGARGAGPQQADAAQARAASMLVLPEPGIAILLVAGAGMLALSLRQRARRLAARRPGRTR